jgi:hypothetical protein
MKLLSPLLRDLAETQVGNPSPDIATAPNVFIRLSLLDRWPKQFSSLDSNARQELLELLTELLEVGCILHLMSANNPHRADPAKVTNTPAIKAEWIDQAYVADTVMRRKGWKQIYSGMDEVLVRAMLNEKVMPFFRSHGVDGGFLGFRTKRLYSITRKLFYAGMQLGVLYDAQARER